MLQELFLINTTVQYSLNLLLSVIVNVHFQSDICIAHYYDSLKRSALSVSGAEVQTIPTVVNSNECNHGCRQFIIEDPLVHKLYNPYKSCMIQHGNTQMKTLIILQLYNLSVHLNHSDNFGRDVIFIERNQNYFDIKGFDDLHLRTVVLLNRWSINRNNFIDDNININSLFKARWRTNPNAFIKLQISQRFEFIFKTVSGDFIGMDVNVVRYFAKHLGVKFKAKISYDAEEEQNIEYYFYLDHASSGQKEWPQTYPSTEMHLTYFVPIPK